VTTFSNQDILTLLLLIAPIALIQLGVVIYALLDLRRRSAARGGRKLWALLLILLGISIPTGLIVAGVYLAWGRNVEALDDSHS
jgi:hypothetical protein